MTTPDHNGHWSCEVSRHCSPDLPAFIVLVLQFTLLSLPELPTEEGGAVVSFNFESLCSLLTMHGLLRWTRISRMPWHFLYW